MQQPEEPQDNPIGRHYLERVRDALQESLGKPVDTEVLSIVTQAILNTQLEFVGVSEIAERLGISRQRVSSLSRKPYFPSEAGRVVAGGFWLLVDIDAYTEERQSVVSLHMGIPKSKR